MIFFVIQIGEPDIQRRLNFWLSFFMLVDKQRKAEEKIKKNFDIWIEKSGGFMPFFQMETDLNTVFSV